MKNKILFLFLAAVVVFSIFTVPADAASASVSVSAAGSVIVGNQVRVSIQINGQEAIGSWRFSLNYDPAYLDYVSGADSGGGGALLFADSLDHGVASISKSVVFRAKKIGATTVTLPAPQVVGFDTITNMAASAASCNIRIDPAPTLSGDNNLSALAVSAGELTPAFSAGTTAYTVTVPFEVTRLDVAASASHAGAAVAVTPGELAVGENRIDVTVTAQNGSAKTYTVTVTRQKSELADATVVIGEKTYSIGYDPAAIPAPTGYAATTALYQGRKILAYASPLETVRIVYLTEGEASAWYLYDEETSSFSPMVTLSGTAGEFLLLTLPGGFAPTDLTVGERTLSVYASEDSAAKGVYLVYAMAPSGDPGFYYYDAKLSSFTSFFSSSTPASATPAKTSGKPAVTTAPGKADQMEILALSLGILSVLLFIGLILALALGAAKRKRLVEELSAPAAPAPVPTVQTPAQESDWKTLYGIDPKDPKNLKK